VGSGPCVLLRRAMMPARVCGAGGGAMLSAARVATWVAAR
jgi:hypothetical protein